MGGRSRLCGHRLRNGRHSPPGRLLPAHLPAGLSLLPLPLLPLVLPLRPTLTRGGRLPSNLRTGKKRAVAVGRASASARCRPSPVLPSQSTGVWSRRLWSSAEALTASSGKQTSVAPAKGRSAAARGTCWAGSPSLPDPARGLGQGPAPLSLLPHLWKGGAEPNKEWQSVLSRGGDVFVAETASRAACGGQRTWGPSPGTSRSTSLPTFRASGKPWVFVKVRASCLRESRVPTLARPSRQAPPYGCRACPGGPRHRA